MLASRHFTPQNDDMVDMLHPGMLAGLRAVAPLRGLSRRVLVYRGNARLRTKEGIDVLPALELARELADGTLWP
jgi:hypothetical protein